MTAFQGDEGASPRRKETPLSDSTANTDTATAGEATTGQSQEAASEPITTQEDLNQLEQTRLARERSQHADDEELKECAANYDEVEESSKSEIQKVIERAKKAKRELEAKATES